VASLSQFISIPWCFPAFCHGHLVCSRKVLCPAKSYPSSIQLYTVFNVINILQRFCMFFCVTTILHSSSQFPCIFSAFSRSYQPYPALPKFVSILHSLPASSSIYLPAFPSLHSAFSRAYQQSPVLTMLGVSETLLSF
jgi:hypothetical protein